MKIKIDEAKHISISNLESLGFSSEEAELITNNLIDAELAGRKSHGFIRLISFKVQANEGKLNTKKLVIDVINESFVSLHIDGHYKLGYGIIYKSLDLTFKKVKISKIVSVGIKNVVMTGYIGGYARKAVENDLIFIGYHNSPARLIPYGAKTSLWGTNALTVGIPAVGPPIILDMASSQITFSDLLMAKNEGRKIRQGTALDNNSKPTTDSAKAMLGGLLPFAGHKGSGLAFIIELLGGILTGSTSSNNLHSNWGSFYILIDPTLFRPLVDFKKDVKVAIDELKNAPRAEGFKEIYFPGEQSYKRRQQQLTEGVIELDDKVLKSIKRP